MQWLALWLCAAQIVGLNLVGGRQRFDLFGEYNWLVSYLIICICAFLSLRQSTTILLSIELATVRLRNAEGVPSENNQRQSLEQEIALSLIMRSLGQSAT